MRYIWIFFSDDLGCLRFDFDDLDTPEALLTLSGMDNAPGYVSYSMCTQLKQGKHDTPA